MYVELPVYKKALTTNIDEFVNAIKTKLDDMAYNNKLEKEDVYSSINFLNGVGYLLQDIIERIADFESQNFTLTSLIRIILMAETVMEKYHIEPKTRFNKLLEIIEMEKKANKQKENKDYSNNISFVPIKRKNKFF